MSEAKQTVIETQTLHTIVADGEAVDLDYVIQRLKLGLTKGENGKLTISAEHDYDGVLESVELNVTFDRTETDTEYNQRLARERRERASQTGFDERKKARDILKLKEEAKRLGFLIALPQPE